MTMRVAIIGSRGYPSTYGGFETFVRFLAPYLVRQGDDVTVYCHGPRKPAQMVDGVRCVFTGGINRKTASTLTYGLTAVIHARRQRFDAVLVLNVANGFYLPPLKREGVPVVVNVDGIEWERDKWSRLGKAVFRAGATCTARWADELIVDSRAIGAVWEERFGHSSIFIPYGAPIVTRVLPKRVTDIGLPLNAYTLMVARLIPENNIELFLDAVERLPVDVPAVVVGDAVGASSIPQRLRSLATSRPGFRWLGHVKDQELLEQLWVNCGVYFHGHSVGGTNPALLQALGCGSPTLAVDTPFNREVLGADDQLVPAQAEVLAERLLAILTDDGRRRELAARGRAMIAERYRWEDVCTAYRGLFAGLARRTTSASPAGQA